METLDFDHNIFHRPDAGDESLFVIFYMGTLKNDAKTEDAGRPIIDDVEYVKIIIPGDKNNIIERPVTDSDKRRFPKQYAAFKATGKEDDQISGTRLKDWPFLSRGQCEELSYLGIKTVEQLAEVGDAVSSRVPGMITLKANAKTWIAKSTTSAEAAKITKRMSDQDQEIATLKEVIRQMGVREEARQMAEANRK